MSERGKGTSQDPAGHYYGHDEPYQGSPHLGPTHLSESGSVGSLLRRIFRLPTLQRVHIEVQIKASKTDQYRQGTRVALGATGTSICPVSALLDYLTIRGNQPGVLFVNENGSPMRRGQFVLEVQQALQQMGVIGHHFNGHSFRIGAATSASQASSKPP